MTGRFRLGKMSIGIRNTAKTLPSTMPRITTMTVNGRRKAKLIGFMAKPRVRIGEAGNRYCFNFPTRETAPAMPP